MEEGEDEKQGPRQAEKEETKTSNNLTVMSQKTSIEQSIKQSRILNSGY